EGRLNAHLLSPLRPRHDLVAASSCTAVIKLGNDARMQAILIQPLVNTRTQLITGARQEQWRFVQTAGEFTL
ncbi:MAG TPA: hypothetical protein VN448_08965, partial [Gammaproteobacteria bacterium]|nr:hypothetical protein [Gammaproteobacteria bacterium]